MKCVKFLIIVFLLMMLTSCGRINEEKLKSEIEGWWGAEIIDEIIIDDISKKENKLTVLAQLVVSCYSDTTKSFSYEFEKFSKGWRITKGPFDDVTKLFLVENTRLNHLMMNMHNTQIAAECYFTSTGGIYPISLTVSIDSITIFTNKKKNVYSFGFDGLKDFTPRIMINPYFPKELSIIVGLDGVYQWFYEYKGKVVYFPTKKGEAYIIRGSTDTGFIDLVLYSVK